MKLCHFEQLEFAYMMGVMCRASLTDPEIEQHQALKAKIQAFAASPDLTPEEMEKVDTLVKTFPKFKVVNKKTKTKRTPRSTKSVKP